MPSITIDALNSDATPIQKQNGRGLFKPLYYWLPNAKVDSKSSLAGGYMTRKPFTSTNAMILGSIGVVINIVLGTLYEGSWRAGFLMGDENNAVFYIFLEN